MESLVTPKAKAMSDRLEKPKFYHATLVQLDGKPLFARGSLPTIHSSLTYAVWYIYCMIQLDRASQNSRFYIYQLIEAERYLTAQGDGLYSVSAIGSIPYDDRNEGLLAEAPPLFKKSWDWDGKLTYIPARCLKRVSASTIRQEVNLDEWLKLCQDLDDEHPIRGMLPSNTRLVAKIPELLKPQNK
jgi:hypothetical protein